MTTGKAPITEEFRADPRSYWRAQVITALVLAALGWVALSLLGREAWVGPLAAILAVGVRGGYLYSEAMAQTWTLSPVRLSGPGGRDVPLARITEVRRLLGDVQIVTDAGDKHLLRYLSDSEGAVSRIEAARAKVRQ